MAGGYQEGFLFFGFFKLKKALSKPGNLTIRQTVPLLGCIKGSDCES